MTALRAALLLPLSLLRFWWDPEPILESGPKNPDRLWRSPLMLGLVLAAIGVLHATGHVHLTCWTPRFHTPAIAGFLLAGHFALVLCIRAWPARRFSLEMGFSLVLAMAAAPAMTLLTAAGLLPFAWLLRSGAARAVKWAALFAWHALMMALYHFRWFPDLVYSPVWGPAGLMWAFFVPLRLLWFTHQALRRDAPPASVAELFHYVFLLPAVILIPYMFALPRREDLQPREAPDPGLEARGTLRMAAGLFFAISYNAIEPAILWLSDTTGIKALIIPWVYPMEPVFWALSSAYILTGLYNSLGYPVTAAFLSPLASDSVLEWWRRWNVHFRDLLVDIFFYPLVLGRRSHPYLRLWLGAFGVFIVGSTLLHWGVKHYFMNNALAPYWSMLVENSVMFLAVGTLLHLERRAMDRAAAARKAARAAGLPAPPPRVKPRWMRIAGIPLTYLVVFSSVMGGYAANLLVEGTVVDRPTLVLRHADELRRRGDETAARRFRELAAADFRRAVDAHADLRSPWRIRERHAAVKLILLALEDRDGGAIPEWLGKLGWDPGLAADPQALAARCRDELSRYRGWAGLLRLKEI